MDAIDREFSWDDAIENDSPEYVVLPEGEYNFQVVNLERKRYQGGAKLPACNMAEVKILVTAPDGKQATVQIVFICIPGPRACFANSLPVSGRGSTDSDLSRTGTGLSDQRAAASLAPANMRGKLTTKSRSFSNPRSR